MKRVTAAVVLGLALTGCGGGQTEAGTATPDPQPSLTASEQESPPVELPDPEPTLEGPEPAGVIALDMKTEEGYSGSFEAQIYEPATVPLAEFRSCDLNGQDPTNMWVKYYLIAEKSADTSPADFPWAQEIFWDSQVGGASDYRSWLYCLEGQAAAGGAKDVAVALGTTQNLYVFALEQATPKHPNGDFSKYPNVDLFPLGNGTSDWVKKCSGAAKKTEFGSCFFTVK